MLMHHSSKFFDTNGWAKYEKIAAATAWWQDSIEDLQMTLARSWYGDDFVLEDLHGLVYHGHTHQKVKRTQDTKFYKNENRRAAALQLIVDSCEGDDSRSEFEAFLAVARTRVRNLDEAREEEQQTTKRARKWIGLSRQLPAGHPQRQTAHMTPWAHTPGQASLMTTGSKSS